MRSLKTIRAEAKASLAAVASSIVVTDTAEIAAKTNTSTEIQSCTYSQANHADNSNNPTEVLPVLCCLQPPESERQEQRLANQPLPRASFSELHQILQTEYEIDSEASDVLKNSNDVSDVQLIESYETSFVERAETQEGTNVNTQPNSSVTVAELEATVFKSDAAPISVVLSNGSIPSTPISNSNQVSLTNSNKLSPESPIKEDDSSQPSFSEEWDVGTNLHPKFTLPLVSEYFDSGGLEASSLSISVPSTPLPSSFSLSSSSLSQSLSVPPASTTAVISSSLPEPEMAAHSLIASESQTSNSAHVKPLINKCVEPTLQLYQFFCGTTQKLVALFSICRFR